MFQVYIIHLSREFSMKLLLAFVECMQFQKYVFTNIEIDGDVIASYLFNEVELYDDIIKSDIVYSPTNEFGKNDNDIAEYKRKATKLYEKYIEYGSEYEILITKSMRQNMSDVMSHLDWINDDEYNMNDVLKLFNECCIEIYRILLMGFGRFQATKQYTKLSLTRNDYQSVHVL